MKPRLISNAEMADLPTSWENPTVDTLKFYQTAIRAWEVDQRFYLRYRTAGGLCQQHEGHFYVA